MRPVKRLVVWAFEIVTEALLLGLCLTFLSYNKYGPSDSSLVNDILFFINAVFLVFMIGTGYLLTTGIFRMAWVGRGRWVHPIASVVLFSIHLQALFIIAGGLDVAERLKIQAAGACIVLACTFTGGWLLRQWGGAGGPGVTRLSPVRRKAQ